MQIPNQPITGQKFKIRHIDMVSRVWSSSNQASRRKGNKSGTATGLIVSNTAGLLALGMVWNEKISSEQQLGEDILLMSEVREERPEDFKQNSNSKSVNHSLQTRAVVQERISQIITHLTLKQICYSNRRAQWRPLLSAKNRKQLSVIYWTNIWKSMAPNVTCTVNDLQDVTDKSTKQSCINCTSITNIVCSEAQVSYLKKGHYY